MKRVALVVLASVILLGCRKSKEDKPVVQVPEPADISVVFNEFDLQMEQGNTNAALQLLESAFADAQYSHARDPIFVRLIQVLLMAGRVDDAKAGLARMWPQCSGEAFQEGLSTIHYYYVSQNDLSGLENWTQALLDMKLPPAYFQQAARWHLDVVHQKDGMEAVCGKLPALMARMDGAAFTGIIHGFANGLVAQKHFADVEKLLAALAGKADTVPELQRFQDVMRTELLIVQDRLEEADRALIGIEPRVQDSDLQRLFSMLAARFVANARMDDCDRLCERILGKHPDKPAAHQTAARTWIDSSLKAKNIAAVPARMQKLLEFKVDLVCLTQIYMRLFYDVTAKGSEVDQAAMLAFGHMLRSRVEPDVQKQLNGMFFDAAVLQEDYAGALKILDLGIGQDDAEWIEMASNKIKAHMALKEGRKGEAVQRFRKFMEQRAKSDEPVRDPISGMIYTREMTLGFNAMRIADIQKSMGDEAGANASYKDARANYNAALENLKPATEEYKYVQAELTKLP